MNLAFVSTGYYPKHSGGGSISTHLIVEELRSRGFGVDVFTTTGSDKQIRKIAEGHYEVPDGTAYSLPDRVGKNYGVFTHLSNFKQYDLIHTYGFGPLPGIVTRSSVPVLGTANNLEWACINWTGYLQAGCPEYGLIDAAHLARQDGYGMSLPLKLGMEAVGKQLSIRADHLTVQTEGMNRILQRCGYPTDKITTVPNLLDPRFDVKAQQKENHIIYVGRLVEKKGALDIVNSYTDLPSEIRDNWTFSILGDGPYKEKIQNIASQSDANINVQYYPYEDLPNIYQSASVLIHGSKYPEPFSRTWLEAMASETAIIASRNPSSESVLSEIAELYDPFDKDDLRESLMSVLTTQEIREQLSTNGKKQLKNYRIECVVDQYVNIYESLIEQ
jgi:glycosyltransferase involved in cell wall biosynthesis